jgi:hypothetical protein
MTSRGKVKVSRGGGGHQLLPHIHIWICGEGLLDRDMVSQCMYKYGFS